MKRKILLAVLLTAVFFVPLFLPAAHAEDAAFAIDERRVLPGMSRSYLQGYVPSVSRNEMTLLLPVTSPSAVGTIQAEILPADEGLSPFPPQSMAARAQRAESGVWPLRFTIKLHEDRMNGDYAATICVTGQDAQGNSLRADIPYVFRIRDGADNTEVARLQITDVRADFRVGEDCAVTATLTNPCRTVPFERPVMRISDDSGDILPQSAGALYLDDLAPGESMTVRFPMTVLPKATVAPHILHFDISWAALGQPVSQQESYTLPVTQDIRLESGGLKMATSVIAGDSLSLSLPLMNRGKADIIDVMATLTLPGVTERQSVLVGTIAPGETKTAQLSILPGKDVSGAFTGTLTVEATDNDGNPATLTLPVALTVEKPAPPIAATAPAEGKEASPLPLYVLGGCCALLVVLCIVQRAVLGRKIRRLEEDRL